jgi:hypothetical protein
MHRLRDIRNEAAHNVNQVSFETEPIRSWMRELKYLDKPIADPRSKLIITLMSSGLLVTAAHNSGEEYGSEDEDRAPDAGDGELPSYVSGPRPGLPSRGGDLTTPQGRLPLRSLSHTHTCGHQRKRSNSTPAPSQPRSADVK